MGGRVSGRKKLGYVVGAAAIVASGVYVGAPPASAAFPGLNGKIACASFRDGNSEIYTFNPNGTELEPTRLTNNPASDSRPRYRSDGRLIAFESNRSGTSEIWIMDADGGNLRQLTFSGGNSSPTWHPDGSQIMYQSTRFGQFQLWKINIDGTGETQLTNTAQENTLPAWSPDGTSIAFSSRRIDPAADVHTMTPLGTNNVDITNSPREDSWPAWSPNGDQIAFHSRLDDPNGEEIYRMNPDGSGRTRLTFNIVPGDTTKSFDIFPFYSPDGTRIGWNSGRDALPGGNFGDIYTMNAVDGSDVRRITSDPSVDQRCDWQPLCTIYGAGDIVGTPGDDVICGSEGPDRIAGLGGNDVIYGFGGDDQIAGGDGNDRIFGGLGNDRILGGAGQDFISGGPGDDALVGDAGERMDPGAGADRCALGSVYTCPPRLS